MPKLNRRVELLHRAFANAPFPTETLTPLITTWAEIKQLASKRIETDLEQIQSTERISVTIRYRILPDSLVIKFNNKSYNVTEINHGEFDKRYLTLFADCIGGAV